MATITRSGVKYHDMAATTKRHHGSYTGPAIYATGGDSFTPADLGLGTIVAIHFTTPISVTPEARLCAWSSSANKVIWFDMAGAEIAGAVDLSTFTAQFEAVGY